MANVIVRGMKMPKSCDMCWALDDCGDYPRCRITDEQRGYTFPVREKRMGNCPLLPLPEGHGRLGDLDELETTAIDAIEQGFNAADILLDIRFAPTIIEAEGGDNE